MGKLSLYLSHIYLLSFAWFTGNVSNGCGGAWKSNSAKIQVELPVTYKQTEMSLGLHWSTLLHILVQTSMAVKLPRLPMSAPESAEFLHSEGSYFFVFNNVLIL